MREKRWKWWHGVLFYAGVQAAVWGMRRAARHWTEPGDDRSREEDRDLYRSQRLPVFAPPGAVFPVAWSINCCCAIAGGIYVLNLSRHKRGRTKFLVLQSTAWGLFVLFDTAYFGLRSPMNAAAVTLGYTAVTAASIDTAVREMREPRAALALATTAAWLALANPLAIAQAAWNRDPFWKVGPFCEPPQGWEKLKGGAEDSATEARTHGWDDADAER